MKLYRESKNGHCDCGMDRWQRELFEKKFDELTEFDVTRMLVQNVDIDLALNKAVQILKSDPLAGTYDGHILEMLLKLPKEKLQMNNELKNVLIQIKHTLNIENNIEEQVDDTIIWVNKKESYKKVCNVVNDILKKMDN